MLKIAVIFPTQSEAKYFDRNDVKLEFSGVGLTASAYNTLRIIRDENPDIIIMAGIAGIYKHSSLKIGDTVVVSHETEADLGFFYPEGFRHISDMDLVMDFEVSRELPSPYLPSDLPFKTAKSNSMNAAMAEFVNIENVEIENMEGYAFFHVCTKEKREFYELRSISNVVDIDHDYWDYDASIKNLTTSLNTLIDYLQNKHKQHEA